MSHRSFRDVFCGCVCGCGGRGEEEGREGKKGGEGKGYNPAPSNNLGSF